MALTVTRNSGESVLIGDDIKVTVHKCDSKIRVVIDAPRSVKVLREELVTRGASKDATHAADGRR